MSRTSNPRLPVLIVDDELHALQSTETLLLCAGMNNVRLCQESRQVMKRLAQEDIGVVLLDLSMPQLSGQQLLPEILETYPDIPVIIATGLNEVETAVQCMRAGAFDYMVKPIEENRLLSGVQRASELRELRLENRSLRDHLISREALQRPEVFAAIVTRNEEFFSIFRYIELISQSSRPVLISGETGVGKELFARAVHDISGREGPFLAVNAAGLDEYAFSDTLFGHERGAFTGAQDYRKGLIEQAKGGTLFLDEFGDLNAASQVKLLRLVQSGEYSPLGSDIPKWSDARLIMATNRDLSALQESGQFRKDLYHRLQTHHIRIPPLRKHLDDLPCLVEHFLEQAAASLGKKTPVPPKELCQLLATYHFPGNVRELESMIFDAVTHHESKVLSMEVFKARIDGTRQCATDELLDVKKGGNGSVFSSLDQLPTLRETSALLIEEAMKRSHGNQSIAARLLGITRSGLNKRLKHETE